MLRGGWRSRAFYLLVPLTVACGETTRDDSGSNAGASAGGATAGAAGVAGQGGGGNGGNGGVGGNGGSVVDTSDDCASDAECPGGQCVELAPGGYRVCATGHIEAQSCAIADPVPFPNECCQTSECAEGYCVEGPWPQYCGGPAVQTYNYCAADECESAADCTNTPFGVCFPAGSYGYPTATCVTADCQVDSDCADEPGGKCLLVDSPCCLLPLLTCVYAGGCRSLADCPKGSESCHAEDGRAICSGDRVLCPL